MKKHLQLMETMMGISIFFSFVFLVSSIGYMGKQEYVLAIVCFLLGLFVCGAFYASFWVMDGLSEKWKVVRRAVEVKHIAYDKTYTSEFYVQTKWLRIWWTIPYEFKSLEEATTFVNNLDKEFSRVKLVETYY